VSGIVWRVRNVAGRLLALSTCAGVAQTACQPLLPEDLVPKQQMGTVSGWYVMRVCGRECSVGAERLRVSGGPWSEVCLAWQGSIIMNQTGPLAVDGMLTFQAHNRARPGGDGGRRMSVVASTGLLLPGRRRRWW
jgi:hypothetical protein